jgi:hypothetical protein
MLQTNHRDVAPLTPFCEKTTKARTGGDAAPRLSRVSL